MHAFRREPSAALWRRVFGGGIVKVVVSPQTLGVELTDPSSLGGAWTVSAQFPEWRGRLSGKANEGLGGELQRASPKVSIRRESGFF